MKKTRLFIGLAALVAVVSMNMHHAWMNYGIYSHVAAAAPSEGAVGCEHKDGYETYFNMKQTTHKINVMCVESVEATYYKESVDGTQIIATEKIDRRADTRTLTPADADLSQATSVQADTTFVIIESIAYVCSRYHKNECCYDKSAILDCDALLKQTF